MGQHDTTRFGQYKIAHLDPLPKPLTLPLCVFLLTRLEYPIHLLDILLVHLYGYAVRRNLTKFLCFYVPVNCNFSFHLNYGTDFGRVVD